MASTPAPTKSFQQIYSLTDLGGGQYRVDNSYGVSDITVTDTSDGGSDNLQLLGDIPNDNFMFTSSGGNGSFPYLAESTDKQDLIGLGGVPVLFTNRDYAQGTVINTDQNAFALCFVSGTLIRTHRGDVAVEDLIVGDRAITASGQVRPIIWIGHRDIEGGGKPLPHDQQPVRIRANAFGPGLPARTLRLSPGHPVLVGADADGEGGVLVPVMCLINGTTIARESVEAVTYWHVELDAHDILLAEGLPAESYIDGGDRPFFTQASDHALHNPDFVVPGWSARCRPVAIDGPLVEAERLRLDAVFAAALATHGAWNDADAWLAA